MWHQQSGDRIPETPDYSCRVMVQCRPSQSEWKRVNSVSEPQHILTSKDTPKPFLCFSLLCLNHNLVAKGRPLGHNKNKLVSMVMKNWATSKETLLPTSLYCQSNFLWSFCPQASFKSFQQPLNAGHQAALHLDTMCVANNLKRQDSIRAFFKKTY